MDREGPSQAVVAAVAGAVAGDVNAVAAAQDTQLARRMQQQNGLPLGTAPHLPHPASPFPVST